MARKYLMLVVVLLIGFCMIGSAENTAERIFTDDCGREVSLPDQIERIVPSGPLAQIVLFAVAPDMFTACASKWQKNAVGYIDEKYLNLPVLGTLYGSTDLNIEVLAAQNPQVIIDIGEAKKSVAEDMDELEQKTRIPSVHIEANLETIADAFRKIGLLLSREERAERAAKFCERIYKRTSDIMGKVGNNKIRALYILGEEGLNVLANGSYHAELFDMLTDNLAVVENPIGKGTGNEVTMEQIAYWNPEFIVFGSQSVYSEVGQMETWKDLSVIQNGNFVEVPDGPYSWMGNPPSVQRYLGMIWLTKVLYPEYCDYDVKADVTEYYDIFYGHSITDEQYEALTANAFLK